MTLAQFIVALSKPIAEVDKEVGVLTVITVILIEFEVAVHPLASVIVNVYVPLALTL